MPSEALTPAPALALLSLLACAGDATVPPPVLETVEDQGTDLDGWFFDPLLIHEIEIELPTDSVTALYEDPWTYVPGDVVIDGDEVPEIGVRLRGKIGSFRELSGKPKLKLHFNATHPERRYHGLESLALNNGVQDCSFLAEPLSLRLFAEAGLPAPRTTWATVQVNGADYGLYLVIEAPDDRFLRRTWPDGSGNLYDGKYAWYGGWSYTLVDFLPDVDHLFQLEEGAGCDHADVYAVTDAVVDHWGSPAWYERTGERVDWDRLHTHLAVEQLVGHNDGYALNSNNYRVYFDPEDGLAELVTWDLDNSFMYDWEWGMSWGSPRGVLAAGCWTSDACASAQREAVREVLEGLDREALLEWYDAVDRATEGAALDDPRRECGASSMLSDRQDVRARFAESPEALGHWWSL